MEIITNIEISNAIEMYPEYAQARLQALRNLIHNVASDISSNDILEETLKWGEPAFTTKHGSTIRIDWKAKMPEQYAMFFHCKTKLIDTFKELYGDTFTFAGNRAILFNIEEEIPIQELKHCIELSLTYHSIKHLPLLGI